MLNLCSREGGSPGWVPAFAGTHGVMKQLYFRTAGRCASGDLRPNRPPFFSAPSAPPREQIGVPLGRYLSTVPRKELPAIRRAQPIKHVEQLHRRAARVEQVAGRDIALERL